MMWTQGKSSLGLTHRASGASEAPQLLPTEAAECSLHQLSVGHWPWAALEGLGCHFQSQGGSCQLGPTLRTRGPTVSHLQTTLREAVIWVHEPAKGLEVGTTASRTTQAEQTGPCPAMVGVWGRGDV